MVESAGNITRPTPRRGPPAWRVTRGGFSFVEILFAVMILGIGFILIAGIFPVAINQTQSNGDETIAASTARSAATIIANLPNTSAYMSAATSSTPTLYPFGPTGSANAPQLWAEMNGTQVLTEDPRYGWAAYYLSKTDAYGNPGDSAQITIIVTRVRNHAIYTAADQSGGTLVGKPISIPAVGFSTSQTTQDWIALGPTNLAAVAPGTFVVIAADPTANTVGSAVGWVLKLGNITSPQPSGVPPNCLAYNLQPGGDVKNSPLFKPAPSAAKSTSWLTAYIIGQGADPDNPNTFSGGAQDVMAYTTIIPLH